MKKFFRATVRDHRTGDVTVATGTTDASNEQQAKAQIQAEVRKLPGRKTATRIDLV
jgi:hypothetical protein